ncbi:YeeE/YedE family protein [Ideonella sp.]|uniref:YeeE/YedE family protein n=1 Tax=Ideonella sp. TaxID=1929293 RepID=UPI003BB4E23F
MSAFVMNPARGLAVLAGGALFGFGLSLSGMIQPRVVLSFLRGQDMGLMLVMGGAVLVTLLAYQLAPRLWRSPLLGGTFDRHLAVLNRDTLIGSALFGVGWGLAGVCPGPAIAGLGAGQFDLLWALAGILAGAWLQGWQASAATRA